MRDSPLVLHSTPLRTREVTGRMRYYVTDLESGARPPPSGYFDAPAAGPTRNPSRPASSAAEPTTSPAVGDLAECYARGHGLSREQALEAILRCSLYPHARLVRWLLLLLEPEFFAADRDYVSRLAALRQRRELSNETAVFFDHVDNQRFLRRVLRLRVSTRRVHALVKQWTRSDVLGG